MDPDSSSPGKPDEGGELFPGPLAACMLALTGLFLSSLVASIMAGSGLAGNSPLMVSMGIGYAIGLGGMATLAARAVPPPHDVRLGLQNFDPQLIPALLALLPCVFLLSEFNFYLEWVLPPSPEFIELREEMEILLRAESTFAALETVVVAVGIIPIVEGFFFFGVLQQGIVARMGRIRGMLLITVLYSVVHFPASGAPGDSVVPLPTWLVLGALLCLVRLASGSILPVILVSSAFSIIHLAAKEDDPLFSVPAFNAPGSEVPALVFWPSLILVIWGISTLWKQAQKQPIAIPIEPPSRRPDQD
ncbi:MAG: type II CAAX endopeptidase family protein [Myxococcota bacterium]|nr:type II CAAX endopeptidase family protein [Myxococcota bacterium]